MDLAVVVASFRLDGGMVWLAVLGALAVLVYCAIRIRAGEAGFWTYLSALVMVLNLFVAVPAAFSGDSICIGRGACVGDTAP